MSDLKCFLSKYDKETQFEVLGILSLFPEKEEEVKKDLEDGKRGWNLFIYFENKEEEETLVEEGTYTCKNKNCKSKRCTISQVQTRSGDEGGTIYIICSVCGERYRL